MYYAQSSFGATNDIVHLTNLTSTTNVINDKQKQINDLNNDLNGSVGNFTKKFIVQNTINQLFTDISNLIKYGKDQYDKLSKSYVRVVNHTASGSSITIQVTRNTPGTTNVSSSSLSYNRATIIYMKPTDTLTITVHNVSKTYTFLNIFGTTTGPQQKRVLTFNSANSVSISTTIPVTSS
jgi:hypothetical protein